MKKCKRKKGFLGAIIGGAIGLIGGIGSSIMNSNASKNAADKQAQLQKELFNKQQTLQNRQDTINYARNLTNLYNNQEYVDDYRKKVQFKYGGKMNDRIKFNKRFKCGGRKKAANGIDWGPVIDAGFKTATNLITTGINTNAINYATDKQKNYFVEKDDMSMVYNDDKHGAKGHIKMPSYIADNNYEDRIVYNSLYKCGGKKRHK